MALETYNQAFPITLSDTVNIPSGLTGGVLATAAGTINAVFQDGTVATLQISAGVVLPIKVKRINTGGTATGLFAMYQSSPNS